MVAGELIPVFVVDPYFFEPERARELPHRMQFLCDSLTALFSNIQAKGSRLLIVRGKSTTVIPRLVEELGVDQVLAYRWTEPVGRMRDAICRAKMRVPLRLYEGETLLPPETVRNKSGQPFSVYTPFARAARAELVLPHPLPTPQSIPPLPEDVLRRDQLFGSPPDLSELGLTRNEHLPHGGEKAARERMRRFLKGAAFDYAEGRDQMALDGTSRLSADLKFGTLSVGDLWNQVSRLAPSDSKERYLAQLLWREFAYSILWDRKEVQTEPFRKDFRDFPWEFSRERWEAWTNGRTGYPVVDASARQLLEEGYVHNRARMISASFLTKHLLIDYRMGEAHYLKYLTDGDPALNNMGWQWSAGCGVDAQPYFRVFNPMSQGQKFDKSGEYVRRYVPELASLPTKFVHEPWKAPPPVLRAAGVVLGKTYPQPIVDHAQARARFLGLARLVLKGSA